MQTFKDNIFLAASRNFKEMHNYLKEVPYFFFFFFLFIKYLCICLLLEDELYTVIIGNIGTDKSEQTMQTQIRLLLKEQSDQCLLCLLFCLHLLNAILHYKIQLFHLLDNHGNNLRCPNF